MDQAKPENKVVCRHFKKCRDDSNMGGHVHVFTVGLHQVCKQTEA
jgi:hypothetical protein